jgi:two-component system, OmpR family, response regulator ChvI
MQSRQDSTAPSKLMAVDDEADITFTLKLVLEQSGFLLDVFNDPRIALSNFKPGQYDLLLLDVKMPRMNGFELYLEIKKKDKNVKACFVTAYELYYESLKQKYPKLEVVCYIKKPIEMDDLVKRIKKELFD